MYDTNSRNWCSPWYATDCFLNLGRSTTKRSIRGLLRNKRVPFYAMPIIHNSSAKDLFKNSLRLLLSGKLSTFHSQLLPHLLRILKSSQYHQHLARDNLQKMKSTVTTKAAEQRWSENKQHNFMFTVSTSDKGYLAQVTFPNSHSISRFNSIIKSNMSLLASLAANVSGVNFCLKERDQSLNKQQATSLEPLSSRSVVHQDFGKLQER